MHNYIYSIIKINTRTSSNSFTCYDLFTYIPCIWLTCDCHFVVCDSLMIVILMYVIHLWLSFWCMWLTYDCHFDVCDSLMIVILMYVIHLRLSFWCMWFTYDCHFDVGDSLTIVILMYVIHSRLSFWCIWFTSDCHFDVYMTPLFQGGFPTLYTNNQLVNYLQPK